LKVAETGINIEDKTITLNAEKTTVTGDLTVPRVMNTANDMVTTIEAGKVLIESTSTQSYGLFQVNSAGEIILKMVDKDGHVVVNIGGTPSQMTSGGWETVELKRVDSNGIVEDSMANFTAYAADLTPYHKLTLGRVVNGSSVTYYLPNRNQTNDQDVIALDGHLFESEAYDDAGIKGLEKVGGFYVKQNDGRFMQGITPEGEPGNYRVPVYHYLSGKMTGISNHTFPSQ